MERGLDDDDAEGVAIVRAQISDLIAAKRAAGLPVAPKGLAQEILDGWNSKGAGASDDPVLEAIVALGIEMLACEALGLPSPIDEAA